MAWTKHITDDELHEMYQNVVCDILKKKTRKLQRKLGIAYFSCNGHRTEDYEKIDHRLYITIHVFR